MSELAWLIEARISPALWLQIDSIERLYRWTTNANEAVRFARKEDAQAVISLWRLLATPTEHMWCGGPEVTHEKLETEQHKTPDIDGAVSREE